MGLGGGGSTQFISHHPLVPHHQYLLTWHVTDQNHKLISPEHPPDSWYFLLIISHQLRPPCRLAVTSHLYGLRIEISLSVTVVLNEKCIDYLTLQAWFSFPKPTPSVRFVPRKLDHRINGQDHLSILRMEGICSRMDGFQRYDTEKVL